MESTISSRKGVVYALKKVIAVIGGGASGLMCALSAAVASQERVKVLVMERKDRIAKKILATGNGRCNLTNMQTQLSNFHGADISFADFAIENFSPRHTVDFFNNLGLMCREEYGGRVYPYCEQASAVVDVIRNEIERLNIEIITNCEVEAVTKRGEIFEIRGSKTFEADKVVVSTGGSASCALGSNGSGFKILKQLGHSINKPVPALVQLKTENSMTKSLKGIRVNAVIKAFYKNVQVAQERGEILFTDYGLSGTAVLQLSGILYEYKVDYVAVDFFPDYLENELVELMKLRSKKMAHLTMENFLVGTVSKKVGYVLIKKSGIEKLNMPVSLLEDAQINKLCATMKNMDLKVITHNGFDNAQVTAGGAKTSEFNDNTLESKIVKGLYATGEVMDIFGDCGGYNLQWAWSTGYLAGVSAANTFLKKG